MDIRSVGVGSTVVLRANVDGALLSLGDVELSPEIGRRMLVDGEDVHANAGETSLMLHLHPELVRTGEIRDDPDRTIGRVFSYTVAQTSADGLTGSPSLATAEEGTALFELIATALAERLEAARVEAPPEVP